MSTWGTRGAIVGALWLLAGLTSAAQATTYYVDFDGGSDTVDGRSTGTAWKHCPGDTAATGVPAGKSLAGGDKVIFKGGVRYRGTVRMNWSGAAGNPIILDGNTAGTFGTGQGIIDGSERLTGWTQCASAAEAGGNPNWQHIYYTTAPAGVATWSANLYEDDHMLWVAQDPNAPDPFNFDNTSVYRSVPPANVTLTTLTEAAYFTQTDDHYWDGSYILIWGNPNVVRILRTTGFTPTQHRISFETLPSNGIYPDRNTLYAMANNIHVLDTPGEFVIAESTRKVHLWPLVESNVNSQEITVSVRTVGISIYHANYVTIRGLKVQKVSGGLTVWSDGVAIVGDSSSGGASRGLTIQDNLLTMNRSMTGMGAIWIGNYQDTVVERNHWLNNVGNRGLMAYGARLTVQDNLLDKNGGTGIYFPGASDSVIQRNTVIRHNGTHANGISVYQGSSNVQILRNRVTDSNIALTTEQSSNLTVAYNVFTTPNEGSAYAEWGGTSGLAVYNNVILQPTDTGKSALTIIGATNVTVKNNILAGGGAAGSTNNIYVTLGWQQDAYYGWSLGPGEMIVRDLNAIFVDPAHGDYHLKTGSPAIDAGTNVGLTADIEGTAVPQGNGPDIGAYEYVVPGAWITGWSVVAAHGATTLTTSVTDGYIEPRAQGLRKLQVAFSDPLNAGTVNNSIVSITGDTSGDLSGRIASVTLVGDRTLEIVLNQALPDAERYTVAISPALRDMNGKGVTRDLDIRLARLVGDVDGSGKVTPADILAVRAKAKQAVGAATARYDVNGSGDITGDDLLTVQRHLEARLP